MRSGTSTGDGGAGAHVRVAPRWALAAALSLLALARVAPSGLYLLAFLAVVVAAHEAAHLAVARRSGMAPTEYFWGFGPEVVSFERSGCRYGVKALFVGGYVKLEGMTPSSAVPDGFDESRTYRAASHRARLATILAGPAVNIAMAVVAFALAAVIEGASLPAAVGGGLSDVWYVIGGTAEALAVWASNLGAYASAVLAALVDSGGAEAPVRFLSPVAQAEVSGWAVDNGPASSLRWLGILSAAVGLVNLLPLPPLDGGHAVVAGVEAAAQRLRRDRRIRLDAARLVPLAYLTVAILVFLSVSALIMDVRDLAAGAG